MIGERSTTQVMLECVILGDSIAVGVATALALAGTSCDVRAGVGWPTERIMRNATVYAHRIAIISAGSNDVADRHLRDRLHALRRRIDAPCVVWIYPLDESRASSVRSVARAYGDRQVSFTRIGSSDGVHPRDYAMLARKMKRSMICRDAPAEIATAAWRSRGGTEQPVDVWSNAGKIVY